MEYKNLNGKIEEQKSEIRWFFAGIFMIPALIVVFIACVILGLAYLLLFDTHHFQLKITPKDKTLSIRENKNND